MHKTVVKIGDFQLCCDVTHSVADPKNTSLPAICHSETALSYDQLAGIHPRQCSARVGDAVAFGDVVEGWRARGGRGCVTCDLAIRFALSFRVVFSLTTRQVQGFLVSLATRLLRPNRCRIILRCALGWGDWIYRLRPEDRARCTW